MMTANRAKRSVGRLRPVVWLGLLGLLLFAGLLAVLRQRGPLAGARVPSAVKLIDDFNDGTDVNLIGGAPFAQAPEGSQVSFALLRVDTPSPEDLAGAIRYELAPAASGGWGMGLNDLDISAAEELTFWLKAERLPVPAARVELVDAFGSVAGYDLARLRQTTRWQRVSIPAQSFSTVSLNQLARFVLRLSAPADQARAGTVYVDDVAFHGPPEVFFESLKDNLYGFPERSLMNAEPLVAREPSEMLWAVAGDTWGYFRDIVDRRHDLPLNYIQTRPSAIIGDYASTTDIGLYLLSVVSAHALDLVDYATAQGRLERTLKQLQRLPTWRGQFYNYYSTTNLQVTRRYISSVDNAWLAVGLIVVRQAFPKLAKPASALLDRMDFGVFFDPANEQLRLGYDVETEQFAPYHYGLLATEARIISLVAIGKGDVPKKHWFRVYRTLPKEWTWQRQAPQGEYKSYFGYDVFQGYYTYGDAAEKVGIVPSWGGSLFEFLMPTMVVDERRLAPRGLGLNNERVVDVHIRYARQERGYPVWGLSPCATPNNRHGGYAEFGVAQLGAKGYKDEAIVTPHVSFLALATAPEAARENIRELLRRFRLYGPYGLYDSVDVSNGDVAYRYLALDQGMTLIALANHLADGRIQRYFEADAVMKRVVPLLEAERFFDDQTVYQPAE